MTIGDREIMDDILNSQKQITGSYNTFSNECVHPTLQADFLNILKEEHNIQFAVFTEMQKRGWYEPETAQQKKISDTRTMFEDVATQIS